MELEYEGDAAATVVRFHLVCQSVWDEVRQARSSPWTLVSTDLPPLLHTVEGRIALSQQRSVILNVMRVNHGDTGPLVWLNATTNSPLPPTWEVVEWRPVADHELSTPAEITSSNRPSRRA